MDEKLRDLLPFTWEIAVENVLDWHGGHGDTIRSEITDLAWLDLETKIAEEGFNMFEHFLALAKAREIIDQHDLSTVLEVYAAGALGPDAMFVVTIDLEENDVHTEAIESL